jgi:hypothetical protein
MNGLMKLIAGILVVLVIIAIIFMILYFISLEQSKKLFNLLMVEDFTVETITNYDSTSAFEVNPDSVSIRLEDGKYVQRYKVLGVTKTEHAYDEYVKVAGAVNFSNEVQQSDGKYYSALYRKKDKDLYELTQYAYTSSDLKNPIKQFVAVIRVKV